MSVIVLNYDDYHIADCLCAQLCWLSQCWLSLMLNVIVRSVIVLNYAEHHLISEHHNSGYLCVECHYSKCRTAECRGALTTFPSVFNRRNATDYFGFGALFVPEWRHKVKNQKMFFSATQFLNLGPMLYNLLRLQFTNICNKLESLSLAGLSTLV
jgi:hypothetical protein